MRNDSRTVFQPEYCHSGLRKCCSGKITSSKIVLTSKSRPEIEAPPRKPVKGCYCHCESTKTNVRVAPRTNDLFSCDHCTNNSDIIEIYSSGNSELAKNSSALLGHETLRRAGEITYLPTSEFLRRVQKRVSCQKIKKPIADSSEIALGSSHGNLGSRLTKNSGRSESATEMSRSGEKNVCVNTRRETGGSRISQEIRTNTVCCNDDREKNERRKKLGAAKKSPRSSSLSVNDRSGKNEKNSEINRKDVSTRKPSSAIKNIRSVCAREEKGQNKRIVRTISAQTHCCSHDDVESKNVNKAGKMESQKNTNKGRLICCCDTSECPEIHNENVWQILRDCTCSIGNNEERVRELSKFRQANYFETHGSVHTLVGSSRSSEGRIEHCECNDRLFITPHCSGKHIKRIHYFPSYIVKEENDNENCRKKRRSRSCDFIGHIVDLGILKIPCNFSNSTKQKYHR